MRNRRHHFHQPRGISPPRSNEQHQVGRGHNQIGIEWPELVGEYNGTASAEGYMLKDGTKLNLSEKDQKWVGVKDTFKF